MFLVETSVEKEKKKKKNNNNNNNQNKQFCPARLDEFPNQV